MIVYAPDEMTTRLWITKITDRKWSGIYNNDRFKQHGNKQYLGTVIVTGDSNWPVIEYKPED